ncbi:MAG TPA: DUF5818 domain-containing protein [Candidatus Acidoferrales bacterium]|jgi:hypothetical protein|nr:DUF5818 domain-containing protein [Candidatus Acidoferrales bacterium]
MRKILLTVATVVFLYAIVVAAAPPPSQPHISLAASQSQGQAVAQAEPEIQIFLGTITKVGNRFVFSDDVSKTSYQLDDQETASKFDEKKVKVTGTLDASHNIIRVQSIEATA